MDFYIYQLCFGIKSLIFRTFGIIFWSVEMFELSQELQDQLVELSELLPMVIIGLFMGFASLFAEPEDNKPSITTKKIIHHIISSIVLCVVVYSVLGAFESINYLVRVGCACAVSFFGIDKVLEILSRFVRAKDGREHRPHDER